QANDIQQWEIFQTPIKLKTFLYHYQNADSIAELYARQIKSNSLLNDYQHIFNRPKGAPLKYMPLLIIFGGCTGCITSLWEKFAKRGKELNKFERIYALYQQQIKADEKFNLAWFKKISGLNEKECETYFRRCRPHNEFILVNNEYDIALYIKNCLQNQTIKN
ncbi:MAG: hypothetical protein H7296_14040, partial [Bacteroidia bacterium]|nr:hypothetical protein [Bacteroidia bacterium]